MDFLVALITFSIEFLVALNTKHEFSCCSKYHNMSFLVALAFEISVLKRRENINLSQNQPFQTILKFYKNSHIDTNNFWQITGVNLPLNTTSKYNAQ